tara:strand:- start:664 stop:933 length:270 start_codon:yes stop_codon:yes gene_type:complete
MTSFLQTILIILLAYYGLKIIFKFSKPYLIKYISKKANERFGQAFGSDPFNNSSIKKEDEGAISIDKSQVNTNTSSPEVGEYVDFEELE